MATFGQLLKGGQRNGQRIVPAGYVPQATTAQAG
jgi:hypothetical protein